MGSGRSSRKLLDLVLPLLGRDGAVEMKGVFLEEAEVKHAAELPFVKELCRVTFSVREFTDDQFERALALRVRTARRALSVLARRAGVQHSFQNVRGSSLGLLRETASESDITIFEPTRMVVATMTGQASVRRSLSRIVVVIDDSQSGRRAMAAALQLASGIRRRLSVLLTPAAAKDKAALDYVFGGNPEDVPARVRTIPGEDVQSLIDAVRSEGAALLVLAVTQEFLQQDDLRTLRERLRCPVCLVREWSSP